jgi:glutamine synthetase
MRETRDDPEYDTVNVFWTGLNGVSRGISVPAHVYDQNVEEGFGFANSVTEFTLQTTVPEGAKYGVNAGDMLAVPDDDPIPLGWCDGVAGVFSNLVTLEQEPLDLCSRTALRQTIDDLASHGYVPSIGAEMEFSLLDATEDLPFRSNTSYDIYETNSNHEFFNDCQQHLATAGYEVLGIHTESQPGQQEFKLERRDALTICDGILLFRQLIRSVAEQHEIRASFMPRPHTGEDANGMHLHLSLWDETENQNLFASDDANLGFPAGSYPPEAGLSDEARYFVGGLLEHMKALTAFAAPTVNSYSRLLPGQWAPVNITWGPDNRSTVVRIPPELGSATRVENRVPDPSANPYLIVAATLAAGLDGIENQTEPGEPTTENMYESDSDRLPRTLWEALNHLERNDVLSEALGASLVTEFIRIKRDEFTRYQGDVSEWERDTYVDAF